MTVDHYAVAGRRWAQGASLVYRPIAAQLIDRAAHSLRGRLVVDAGSGTGVTTEALTSRGARAVAADLSADMLSWNAAPSAVADIRALPFADRTFDDAVAAFVLNHLVDPAAGFAELIRVVRPGGALLATVYGVTSRSPARDQVDQAAQDEGFVVPDWYLEVKATAVPLLGSADSMTAAATAAGLVDVDVDERTVDVGVHEAEQLVDYRLGQAHFGAWLDSMAPAQAAVIRRRIIDKVRPVMEPYLPRVVFLSATVPALRAT